MGINSVGTESVYQNWQFGKAECLAGRPYSWDTRKTQLSPSCLDSLHSSMCKSHESLHGMLIARYPRKLFSFQLLESLHSLFITQPLHSNPTINTGYKRLNRITIKFGTKLKPTKHIVINHSFTIMFICKHWIFTVPWKEMTLTMKKQWNV